MGKVPVLLLSNMWFSKGGLGHADVNKRALKLWCVKSAPLILLLMVLKDANVQALKFRMTRNLRPSLAGFLLAQAEIHWADWESTQSAS